MAGALAALASFATVAPSADHAESALLVIPHLLSRAAALVAVANVLPTLIAHTAFSAIRIASAGLASHAAARRNPLTAVAPIAMGFAAATQLATTARFAVLVTAASFAPSVMSRFPPSINLAIAALEPALDVGTIRSANMASFATPAMCAGCARSAQQTRRCLSQERALALRRKWPALSTSIAIRANSALRIGSAKLATLAATIHLTRSQALARRAQQTRVIVMRVAAHWNFAVPIIIARHAQLARRLAPSMEVALLARLTALVTLGIESCSELRSDRKSVV